MDNHSLDKVIEGMMKKRSQRDADAPELERICLLLETIASGVPPTVSLETRNKIALTLQSAIQHLLPR